MSNIYTIQKTDFLLDAEAIQIPAYLYPDSAGEALEFAGFATADARGSEQVD